ncbi:MAG TPA: ABC transporter ATP-binding protein [Burkholderiales bacterium]|nr:ABC transporter ATP-binding protein [Burkholderiales bacterium]
MATASLEIAALEVAYGATPVLHKVSLAVAAGEFVALLGPSGCGKTTLLRAVSGFVPASGGRIAVGGRDITHAPPDKRGMAMVFQSYALWPHMTTAQNLGYGLKLRRVAKHEIAKRVAEILAMLKLEGFGERNVTQLSGGQRQRVALGRALAISPELLLLDEPLSNLDARIREDVRHEIKALQAKLGITTIHVTHDREEAMVMADRIAILDAGRIAQLGSPEEVYNRPNSPFVAAFMGAGNVLVLEARPAGDGVEIQAGAHNDGVRVPGCGLAGPVLAHFRSESARLGPVDERAADRLMLRGRITQASYPGGFYRYAVAVGQNQFMVDDHRRLAVGETVGIGLPVSSLHFFSRREA